MNNTSKDQCSLNTQNKIYFIEYLHVHVTVENWNSILVFPLIAPVDNCEYEDIYFSTIMIFSRYSLQFDWESRAEIKAKKEAT